MSLVTLTWVALYQAWIAAWPATINILLTLVTHAIGTAWAWIAWPTAVGTLFARLLVTVVTVNHCTTVVGITVAPRCPGVAPGCVRRRAVFGINDVAKRVCASMPGSATRYANGSQPTLPSRGASARSTHLRAWTTAVHSHFTLISNTVVACGTVATNAATVDAFFVAVLNAIGTISDTWIAWSAAVYKLLPLVKDSVMACWTRITRTTAVNILLAGCMHSIVTCGTHWCIPVARAYIRQMNLSSG
jgi:hypothetical protein